MDKDGTCGHSQIRMGDNYSINGVGVTFDQFADFRVSLSRIGLLDAGAFADGLIEDFEIDRFFDVSGDGKLTVHDVFGFKNRTGAKAFENVTTLLATYGYNPYFRTANFYEVLDDLKMDDPSLSQIMFPAAWRDRTFVSAALTTDGEVFERVSKKLRSDPALATMAVRDYSPAVADMGKDLLQDKNFILELARLKPGILSDLPAELCDDKDIVLACVAKAGDLLRYASERLRADRETVFTAVLSDGLALEFAAPHLKKDITVVVTALVNNGLAYRFADESLQSHNVVINTALNQNPLAWLYVKSDDLSLAYFLEFAAEHKITVPKEALEYEIKDLLHELRAITAYPERFGSLATILDLWVNRHRFETGVPDDRPKALLLYNQSDENRAFVSSEVPDAVVNDGRFNALYYEVKTDAEIATRLKLASRDGESPIHTVVFAGHGSRFSINFGPETPDDNAFERDKKNLDRGDFFLSPLAKLAKYIAPDGQVILYACTTGQGGAKRANLANAIARRLPATATILTEQNAGNITEIRFNADLKAIITWAGRPYETSGKKNPRGVWARSRGLQPTVEKN